MASKFLYGAAFATVLGALVLGAAPAAMAANWQSLTSNEGGFTVIIEIPYEVHREAAHDVVEKPTAVPTVSEMPGERAMGTQA